MLYTRKREKIVEGGEERQKKRGLKEQSKIQVLPNIGGEKTGFSSVWR